MSSSTVAIGAATLCIALPYLSSLLGSLTAAQRIALAVLVYLALSARSQHRSSKRFQVQPPASADRHSHHHSEPATNVSLRTVHPSRTRSSWPSTSATQGSTTAQQALVPRKDGTVAEKVEFVRSEQCPQLADACYLDAAAAPPFPTGLVQAVAEDVSSKLLSNPHSKSPSAIATADHITATRMRVMHELFGIRDTHNWHLVFTAGTTASLKLVAESIDWASLQSSSDPHARFSYLRQSHTSVVGMRDLAARAGVSSSTFSEEDADAVAGQAGLVALPLQCNATGRRYFDLMKRICRTKADGSLVLLDAASYLSSSTRLYLSQLHADELPDMVAFSFYKIFGYPTGIGGLLVKASAAPHLGGKTYFGGGTVDAILAESAWTKPRREFEARFEDGTVNVHGILAVNRALDYYAQSFGAWDARREYVAGLSDKLVSALTGLRHGNGNAVVRMYRDADVRAEGFGPIVNFNLLTATGAIVPPQEVDRLASISNIHMRMGRHCNPGFVTTHLGIPALRLQQEYAEGAGCDDAGDAALEGGLVSASVRASLCLLNTEEDVERLVGFVARFFLSPHPAPTLAPSVQAQRGLQRRFELASITVYPIKSCAGQELARGEAWQLTPHGLQFDREWIVMNLANGKTLSQKRFPKMALIRPRIDTHTRQLVITIAGTSSRFAVSFDDDGQYSDSKGQATQVCGAEIWPRAHTSPALRSMLSELLGVSCTLARQASGISRHSKLPTATSKVPLIFSNESPFLLINSASVARVGEWMHAAAHPGTEDLASDSGYSSASHSTDPTPTSAQAASFRANFMISSADGKEGKDAFVEDGLSRVVIGGKHVFGVLGECRRCQMVCVDQKTGQVKPQTLKTLARWRRNARGRIIFGSHLAWLPDLAPSAAAPDEANQVWVGMDVIAS
ncbi:related to molybdenum cofactor sulfurase HxB protein [Moesziomyces antarcticus]|nr:related to molybdenum cofactor sulfurase HxB protein [Moesziomyces antarcticus]